MDKSFAHPLNMLDLASFVCGFGQVRANEPTPIPDSPHRVHHQDVVHMQNEGIEEVAASTERAEETGDLRRMVYSPCCPVMAEEAEQAGTRA